MVWWSESILGEGGGRRALEFWASSATGSYNETRCICREFGRAILCSDAATEAARYGFTESVDRPEGFLVLGVASQGDQITKIKTPPEVLSENLVLIQNSRKCFLSVLNPKWRVQFSEMLPFNYPKHLHKQRGK
ncbi:hypothetical protein EV1_030521 [Malus domestica]